ncbi:MAG TPA: penicillin acylase family protein, partial [Candidatus Binatia bacterium]|nr:penicillin acylase family protein [Candidatus Binatia bacterium]
MSTLAEIGESRAHRSPVPRLLFWVVVVCFLVLAAALSYAYHAAHAALPQLDGHLPVSGLGAAVTVTRDGHGVPTITAEGLDDLFFAQGYVTAQDRLWQMDVMRRFAAGELSEILGQDTLKLDREQRILGLRAAATKSLAVASDRDRGFFAAYARGVNAYIASRAGKLPIEFQILRYSPKPWTPEDSIVIANQMVKDLN